MSQADNFVAVEHMVTLTLTELFRQGFSLSSSLSMRYQTGLVHKWKEIVFKQQHFGKATSEAVTRSEASEN